MRAMLMLAVLAMISGCASLSGNGRYEYTHTAVGGTTCKLIVDSGRTVAGGVDLSLDKECGVTLKTGDIGQGRSELGSILGFTSGMIGVVTGKPIVVPQVAPVVQPATAAPAAPPEKPR